MRGPMRLGLQRWVRAVVKDKKGLAQDGPGLSDFHPHTKSIPKGPTGGRMQGVGGKFTEVASRICGR